MADASDKDRDSPRQAQANQHRESFQLCPLEMESSVGGNLFSFIEKKVGSEISNLIRYAVRVPGIGFSWAFERYPYLLVLAFGSRAAKERLKNPDAPLEQLSVRPEELFLHSSVMAVVATRNVGSVVAFLALTWSTVVLLGGFISELRVKEFWFLTTTSVVMATGG
jgi:hypothetical protein